MAEQKRNTRNSKSTKIQPVNDYGRIPVSYTHLTLPTIA